MNIITYTILGGEPPFTVELVYSSLSPNIHSNVGTYEFEDVPIGTYLLQITDSNDCVYEQEIVVNPSVTTTTTTQLSSDLMVVGQAQDGLQIFNENTTNRNTKYSGYPNENEITLYLWMKTLDGEPLATQTIVDYQINGSTGNTFNFIELSDQRNAEVVENLVGFSETISGNIILKSGFIETYLKYTYIKNPLSPDLNINLNSSVDWLYTNIPLVDTLNQYGVLGVTRNNIIMKF